MSIDFLPRFTHCHTHKLSQRCERETLDEKWAGEIDEWQSRKGSDDFPAKEGGIVVFNQLNKFQQIPFTILISISCPIVRYIVLLCHLENFQSLRLIHPLDAISHIHNELFSSLHTFPAIFSVFHINLRHCCELLM